MKNLKMLLGLMVVSVFAFAAVGTVNAFSTGDVVVTTDSSAPAKPSNWAGIGTAIGSAKSAVIELNNDVISTDVTASLTVASSAEQVITIRLNGHTLNLGDNFFTIKDKGTLNIVGSGEITMAGSTNKTLFVVNGGGSLNVTNGVTLTQTATADEVVKVDTTTSTATNTVKSVVMFSSDTTVSSTGAGVTVPSTAKYTTVTVAGEWETAGSVVNVTSAGSKALHAPVINIVSGGEYTSTGSNVLNINGYATVNVKGGTFVSESANDLVILGNQAVLNITGGNFLTEESDKYAINVTAGAATDAIAKNVVLKISAGTFKSGEDSSDEDGALLPAINIESERVLKANEGNVTGGIFYKGVANYVVSPSAADGQISATVASNTLTKGATATSSNGKVTIKTGTPADTEQKPENNKPSTGDNQPSENPKTFDAIGSLIAMAVSSLGVVGTATKKLFR